MRTPLLILVMVGAAGCSPFREKSFDQTVWKDSDPQERAGMAVDLLEKLLAKRLSRKDVIAMLGEPDSGQQDGQYLARDQVQLASTYSYYLGSWSQWKGWDDAYLYVTFGEADVISDAEIDGH